MSSHEKLLSGKNPYGQDLTGKDFAFIAEFGDLDVINKMVLDEIPFNHGYMLDTIVKDIEYGSTLRHRALNGIKIYLYLLTKENKNGYTVLIDIDNYFSYGINEIHSNLEFIYNYMNQPENENDILKILAEIDKRIDLTSKEAKRVREFLKTVYGKNVGEVINKVRGIRSFNRRKHTLSTHWYQPGPEPSAGAGGRGGRRRGSKRTRKSPALKRKNATQKSRRR